MKAFWTLVMLSTVERIELAPTSLKVLIGTICKGRHLVGAFSENGTSIHVCLSLVISGSTRRRTHWQWCSSSWWPSAWSGPARQDGGCPDSEVMHVNESMKRTLTSVNSSSAFPKNREYSAIQSCGLQY